MTAPSSGSSANTLLDLIAGYRVTAVIYAAARLGIPDLLFKGPRTSAELASLTGTHQRSLLRLIRGLVALEICTQVPDGRFQLTEMGTHLASGSDCSVKAWALVEGEMLRGLWGEFIHSIQTGKTADELAGLGQETFEVLAKTEKADLFNQGIAALVRVALPGLLAACDFSGIATLMLAAGSAN